MPAMPPRKDCKPPYPTARAASGRWGSIELRWREDEPDAQTCRAVFSSAPSGAGFVDLTVSFVQREGGKLIREIVPVKIRIREGDSCLVPTRRPAAK